MTILIGMACKDGIMVASDSQATVGNYKRVNEIKLQPVHLRGASAIIGGTGEMRFTNRVIEVFEEIAKDRVISKPRQVADIAEEAVRYVIERYFGESPTQPNDDAKEFEMLLGVYSQGTWGIFVIDNNAVAANEPRYAATGSAEEVAEYLLGRLFADDLDVGDALRIAIYVIEQVKRFDVYCGGEIQAYLLKPTGITKMRDEDIKKIVEYFAEKDNTNRILWQVITKGPEVYDEFQRFLLDVQHKKGESKPGSQDSTP